MVEFAYQDMLPIGSDETPYRLLTTDYVSTFDAGGRTFLQLSQIILSEYEKIIRNKLILVRAWIFCQKNFFYQPFLLQMTIQEMHIFEWDT